MDSTLRDELKEAVDAVWDEALRHLPMAGAAPDAEREVAVFRAVLRTGERDGATTRPGRSDREGARLLGDGGELRLDRTAWPDVVLRQDDMVVALDRPGEPVFEIQSVDDRHHLRLVCQLGDAA